MEEKEEYLERYVNAVKKAIEKAPVRNGDIVDVTDLWVMTSLPIDLMIECVKSQGFEIPSHIERVTNRGKVIAKNPHYIPKDEE